MKKVLNKFVIFVFAMMLIAPALPIYAQIKPAEKTLTEGAKLGKFLKIGGACSTW